MVAAKSIGSLADLDGKTVAVGSANGGTFVTAIAIFERLNIRPHFLYIEQRVALERLKKGEIDAVVAVEGKPLQEIARIDRGRTAFRAGQLRESRCRKTICRHSSRRRTTRT